MPIPAHAPLDLPPRFELDREIGRGGMAVVYRAHDNHLGRFVAIKVLSPDLSSNVGAERFRREIALMATLVHPGIVALFDSGVANGQLFYVMPFVAGESLRARLQRERRLTPEDAANLGADVAEALAYAHGSGIIHRDVKPENIFTVGGRAVLGDFGIARIVGDAAHAARNLTTGGAVIGTVAYMSPEQGLGEENIDGRSDLYSLGCLLYELLCGVPPFVAATAIAVLGKHLTETPQHLADRGTTATAPLAAIVMKLLEKEPANRPSHAADVARQLRAASHIAADEPAPVATARVSIDTVHVEALSFPADDAACAPIAHALGSAIATSLATLPGVRVHVADGPQTTLSVDGSVRRSGQRMRVTMRIIGADGSLRWSDTADGMVDEPFALEDAVSARVAAFFTASVAPSKTAPRSAPVAPPLSEADQLVKLAVSAFSQFGPSGGAASQGYVQEARAYLTRALALEPRNPRALCAMGNLHAVEGNYGLAPRDESIALSRKLTYDALAADHQCAEVYAALTKIALYSDDDLHQAQRHGRRAVDLNPGYPESLRMWSIICKISGRLDDAIDAARAATALSPDTGPLWNTLGDALLAAGRNSEAIDVLKRAISLTPNYSLALERLERAHLAHGDAGLAVELRASRLRIAGRIQRADLLDAETRELGASAAIRSDLRRELDALLELAAASDPFAEDWKRNVADRIAAGYAELGQWSDAMDWVQRIHDRRPGRLRRMLSEMPVDYRGLAVDPRYTRLLRVAGLEELI